MYALGEADPFVGPLVGMPLMFGAAGFLIGALAALIAGAVRAAR